MTEFTKRIVRDNYIYTGCYTNCLQSSIPPCDTGRTRRMGRWGAGEQSAKRGGKRRWGGREAREEEEAVRNLGIERFRKRIRNRRGSNIDRWMKRSWRERERQGWKQGRGIVSKSFEKGNPSNRSTNFWLTSIVHSEFVFRKKEIKDGRWLFKGTRKRRLEESFQVYEINPWTTMEEETKVFFSVRADDPCCWKKRVEISSLFSLNSKGGSPSSSRIPDQRSILCSIGAFFTFKSTKRDWFVYRAKHCACVAMENEGGRSVDPLVNSLVTMVFRTNRESEKTRESTRETGWNGLNFVPFFFFFLLFSERLSFSVLRWPRVSKDCVQYFFVRLRRRSRERASSPWFFRTVTRLVS